MTNQGYPFTVEQESIPFHDLLARTAVFLWGEWPIDMVLSKVRENGSFVLRGTCPHCGSKASFSTVTAGFEDRREDDDHRWIAAAACNACNEYILAIIEHTVLNRQWVWVYKDHYPIGKPDDTVSEDIPEDIRNDYREALRCRWVKAYNATIEMCRRAIEASCIQQGADRKLVLNDMINWVHSQGKITTPLKDMAHKIKLGGNRAAHPSDKTLTETDADGVLEFTREYFQHVYVMPAKMALYDFDKPKQVK